MCLHLDIGKKWSRQNVRGRSSDMQRLAHSHMEDEEYIFCQEKQFDRYESICARCGACCGAEDGDQCVNLEKAADGKYFCKVYENRLGPQRTISGKSFHCIPIGDVIMNLGARPNCAYRRVL